MLGLGLDRARMETAIRVESSRVLIHAGACPAYCNRMCTTMGHVLNEDGDYRFGRVAWLVLFDRLIEGHTASRVCQRVRNAINSHASNSINSHAFSIPQLGHNSAAIAMLITSPHDPRSSLHGIFIVAPAIMATPRLGHSAMSIISDPISSVMGMICFWLRRQYCHLQPATQRFALLREARPQYKNTFGPTRPPESTLGPRRPVVSASPRPNQEIAETSLMATPERLPSK
jgi:hypothetical protein